MTRCTLRDDRGFAPIETAITIPLVFAVLLLIVAAGRVAKANLTVDDAAYSAARAASLARTSGQAQGDAQRAAAAALDAKGLTCSPSSVNVNTAAFSTAPGARSTIDVTVTCAVPLSDLTIPGMPGSRTVTGDASSVLDSYRGRS